MAHEQQQQEIIQEENIPVESTGLDDSIGVELEEHLDTLPDEAKNFIFERLAGPNGSDIVTILGLILGPEALQFFANTKGIVDQNTNQSPPGAQQAQGATTEGLVGGPNQSSSTQPI